MTDLSQSSVSRKRGRNGERPTGYFDQISKRHSSVLGLSSLILAYPYSIPQKVVPVLVRLASLVSDPNPIGETVKSTFREFKRTHQDSWNEVKRQFTEDELYVITDLLISPSYYV
jgi:proteasome activator subunit 4